MRRFWKLVSPAKHFAGMRAVVSMIAVCLTGCVGPQLTNSSNASGSSPYLTIRTAPPTAWPSDPPPKPETIDSFARRTSIGTEEERAQAWEDANGPADFQAEARRLAALLPTAEPDSYVQLRLVRDEDSMADPAPLLGAEVWFKQNAAETLARYTQDRRFVAREGGLTGPEMRVRQQAWAERLEPLDMSWSSSGDQTTGEIIINLGITEAAFQKIARAKGWSWDDNVRFTFSNPPPPAFADPALERHVRAFVRELAQPIIQLEALGIGTIVLEDGCFRLRRDDGKQGPLVMFGYDTQLAQDAEGHIILQSGDTRYRIGELGAWGGPNAIEPDWSEVKALRSACGSGEIVNVRSPQSLRLFSLPYPSWVLDYAYAKSISYDEAWDTVISCMADEEKRGRVGLEGRSTCIAQFNHP